MTFQLDTTGTVDGKSWSDLSPFTQGYIEAAIDGVQVDLQTDQKGHTICQRFAAFSDLAPETLARIIADCMTLALLKPPERNTFEVGRLVWINRQKGYLEECRFLPLTVYLDEGGKVGFV